MSALSDRSLWLAHLRYCTRCPTDLCDRGEELYAAVRESMVPGESMVAIYRPEETWQRALVRTLVEAVQSIDPAP